MARIGPGVRNKPRILQDTCADCGATDPGWASISRGILICDGCCSVHRSLGRHISQVKSLRKSLWHSSQLNMVQTLNSSGANHIWEHTLLDPSTAKGVRRKPQPSDPVHPNKADFIRAKHQLMSFVYRPNRDENLASGDKDVSRQLHASVRTANLETSLRLLSLGADPNYYSTEKGNCPIHVAVTAGQSCQVELLVTYGADPGAFDKDGLTPVDYAREGGFTDIADRLVELQYELTDRLAFYLCNKKPDHKNGQHWIIPELADSPTEISDVAKEAKSRLIALPHHSFEELACDVYDEVDRRETDAIWLSLQNQSALLSDRCSVPFLPVNPEYSSTRNQGRQKLARFNAREFATLIIDILVEARRRMAGTQYQITDKICVDESSHSDSLLLLDSCPSSNFPLTSSPITPEHSCPNLVSGPVNVDPIERCASYDEVYVTSDEGGESSSQGFEGSLESEIGEEEEFYELEDEKSGEGCMSDLLSGMQPLIGSGKKKKKKKKTRSCYLGNDSLGLSPSRHSSATTFSLQVSKHLKEKLLSTRYAMSFGDYHPKKLSIVHPPLRCDNISPHAGNVSTPARSFFVRTFTLPLKLANQKHQQILSRNLSRSQPTSPVVSRKQASNSHTLSSLNTHLIPLTYLSDKKHKNKNHQLKSNNVVKEISQHNTTPSHGNKNDTLQPIQVQVKNNQFVPPPSPSLNHQTLSPPNCPLMLNTNETYPYFPMDNVDLEPCKKCAYNVAANIQHVSFWKNLAASSNSNLDYGPPAAAQYISTSTDIKLEPNLDYFKTSEIKQHKDDCKIQ